MTKPMMQVHDLSGICRSTRFAAVAALMLGAISLAACGSGSSGAGETGAVAGVEVDSVVFNAAAADIANLAVDTVTAVAWQPTVIAAGRLMLDPTSLQTLGSISEGRISSVSVRVGDRVTADQALVMIHSHEIMDARNALVRARAQLDAATARRDLAKTELGRAQRLYEARALAKADLERAQVAERVGVADYNEAVAEQDRVVALIEHLVGAGPLPKDADEHDVLIRTPISGVVTERIAQPGSVVLPGMPLITVGDPTRLQLQLHLTETAAEGIGIGSSVRYTLSDAPGVWYNATITRIAPTVDTLTRTIEVIAKPDGKVVGKAESFVQAELRGKGTGEPVLVVPTTAVQALSGDTVVFAATQKDGAWIIRAVPVRTGRRTTDKVEIVTGLKSGAVVVTRGAGIAKAELLKRRGALAE